jgi:hypothetical protein
MMSRNTISSPPETLSGSPTDSPTGSPIGSRTGSRTGSPTGSPTGSRKRKVGASYSNDLEREALLKNKIRECLKQLKLIICYMHDPSHQEDLASLYYAINLKKTSLEKELRSIVNSGFNETSPESASESVFQDEETHLRNRINELSGRIEVFESLSTDYDSYQSCCREVTNVIQAEIKQYSNRLASIIVDQDIDPKPASSHTLFSPTAASNPAPDSSGMGNNSGYDTDDTEIDDTDDDTGDDTDVARAVNHAVSQALNQAVDQASRQADGSHQRSKEGEGFFVPENIPFGGSAVSSSLYNPKAPPCDRKKGDSFYVIRPRPNKAMHVAANKATDVAANKAMHVSANKAMHVSANKAMHVSANKAMHVSANKATDVAANEVMLKLTNSPLGIKSTSILEIQTRPDLDLVPGEEVSSEKLFEIFAAGKEIRSVVPCIKRNATRADVTDLKLHMSGNKLVMQTQKNRPVPGSSKSWIVLSSIAIHFTDGSTLTLTPENISHTYRNRNMLFLHKVNRAKNSMFRLVVDYFTHNLNSATRVRAKSILKATYKSSNPDAKSLRLFCTGRDRTLLHNFHTV